MKNQVKFKIGRNYLAEIEKNEIYNLEEETCQESEIDYLKAKCLNINEEEIIFELENGKTISILEDEQIKISIEHTIDKVIQISIKILQC